MMDERIVTNDDYGLAPAEVNIAGGNRRSLLKSLLATAVLAITFRPRRLSSAQQQQQPRPGALPPLIDAHCHLFNVTDLAATRFAYVVFLRNYPSETVSQPHGGWLERRIRDAINLLTRGVLTAREETALLTASPATAAAPPARIGTADRVELQSIRREIEIRSPETTGAVAPFAPPPPEPPHLCQRPRPSPATNIGTILKWLGVMRASRSHLTDTLTGLHRASRYEPSLLCPALVDYSCWLGERLISPLPDQVEVMARVALRPHGPAVHAYVPFDPLRAAMVRTNRSGPDGNWDPFELVERALTQYGCIGVKLYPPMGFRPAGNAASEQRYPRHIVAPFGSAEALGRALDDVLDDFWRLCRRLDAPVMTHAAASNDGGAGYGARGDPAFWAPVLAPALRQRVLFGHFGRFSTMSAEQPMPSSCPPEVPVERTWEAVFARHVQANPDAPVFGDISYLSEMFHPREQRRIERLMAFYLQHDPDARHLVFGTDWTMTGLEKKFDDPPGYAARTVAFLRNCGITGEKLERVMHGNAIRFLGLGAGEANRVRLTRFYEANGQSADRLPQA